ncbi:DUF1754-domain-containing protein [Annulohypoxylon maeteangense]|uniref:DUF1754-domain-containing protein n=1 Tax=Annulohypoxylon maeteangense TaxID=1927788 RepID=UPI002008A748|nr:DUF1754-domain-containing protein [Annulohypoxylon maeteangense]KAI0883327.1 DUF1754-domain-containing protein [Annulohypoxylon maeteangense]
MPADDYASVGGGGPLKLKGGKVQKNKKKKKSKANLEHSLATVDDSTAKEAKEADGADDVEKMRQENGDDEDIIEHKTEAERRHEEANRKKMLKMLEDPKVASEFRKTHKERVEGLNTYLSKLSEHHDMPKIGPG